MVYSNIASNNLQTFSAQNIVQKFHIDEAGYIEVSQTLTPKRYFGYVSCGRGL